MSTIPTIVVHGGAGTYARIIHDGESKNVIENGWYSPQYIDKKIVMQTIG